MRVMLAAALLSFYASECMATTTVLREYWEYESYLNEHPEQKKLTQEMTLRISNPPISANIIQDRPIEIDIVYPGSQLSDYWWRNIKALELRLKELNIDFRLRKYSSRPNIDHRQEGESLKKALQNEPDYLIFTLDSSRHKKFAESVLSSNKTKLILINITTPIKQWDERQPLMYVGFDHVKGSILLAQEYMRNYPEQANFGLMYFSPGYISEARGDTFVKYIKHQGDYAVKTAYFTHANRASAYEATLAMLDQQPNIDFIYACSTDVAFGVSDALAELEREDVMVNGWGGGSEIEAIKSGDLDFTIVRMTDETGLAIAEGIKLDLQGLPVPKVFSGKYQVLTKDDDPQIARDLKLKAFRYSNR
ncbi:substrate-binding domain-containing protein [Vibrio rarus]|uniref:substrate-binding domain-containing protein n=1 Tax=Vibrio rarus TaxID=413403 RepID=UPI0021C4A3C2|nr:substrate-binding domain-containing protein [Vibrio rarus]